MKKKYSIFIVVLLLVLLSLLFIPKKDDGIPYIEFTNVNDEAVLNTFKKYETQFEEHLHLQKEAFNTLLPFLSESQIQEITNYLVSYNVFINNKPLANYNLKPFVHNGPLYIRVEEIRSELLTEVDHSILTDFEEQLRVDKQYEGMDLITNHELNVTSENENAVTKYEFFSKDTVSLYEKNKKVIFEVSPILQKKLNLSSPQLSIELTNKDENENVLFDNLTLYEIYQKLNYLYTQVLMVEDALAIALKNYPNQEHLLELMHEQTTFSIVKVDSFGSQLVNENSLAVSERPSFTVLLQNPYLKTVDKTVLSQYIASYYDMAQIQLNKDVNMQVSNSHLDFNDSVAAITTFLDIDSSQFPVELTFTDELIKKASLTNKSVTLTNRLVDENYVLKPSADIKELITYENRMQFMYDYLLTQEKLFTDKDKKSLQDKLSSHLVKLDDYEYYYQINMNPNNRHFVSEHLVSELLVNFKSPFKKDIIKIDLSKDIENQSEYHLSQIVINGDLRNAHGFFIPATNDEQLIGKPITFKLSESLIKNPYGYEASSEFEVKFQAKPITANRLIYNYIKEPTKLAEIAHSYYFDKQLSFFPSFFEAWIDSDEKLVEVFHEMDKYSQFEKIELFIDDQLETTIQEEYEVEDTITLNVYIDNPLFSYLPQQKLGILPFTKNIEMVNKDYPILKYHQIYSDYQNNSNGIMQTYYIKLMNDPLPLELSFDEQIIQSLDLPYETIKLVPKSE